MANLGRLLAEFLRATQSLVPPEGAVWRDWFGRSLGAGPRLIGHCDLGDWNILAQAGQPTGLIDFEQAGPVDPLVELAQLCWLNAHLFDDDLADRLALPPLTVRAKNLRLISDGYCLPAAGSAQLVETMITLAISDTANEAIQARATPDTNPTTVPPDTLWAMAWRARSAAWMLRNRGGLEGALG